MAIDAELGTISVKIVADTADLEKGQISARNALDKMKGSVENANKALEKTKGITDRANNSLSKSNKTLGKTKGVTDSANSSLNNANKTLSKTESSANRVNSAIDGANKSLNKTEGTANRADNALDRTNQTLNKTDGIANRTKKSIDNANQALNKTEGTVDRVDRALDNTSTSLNKTKNSMEGVKASANQTDNALINASEAMWKTKTSADGAKKSIDKTKTSLDRAKKSADKTRGSLNKNKKSLDVNAKAWGFLGNGIRNAAGAFAAAAITSKIISFSDAATSMENKLKLATKSTEDLVRVTKELTNAATETGTSVEATVDLYTKMERATRDLGVDEERLLKVTNSINKAFAISGASTAEAAGSIRQLGQALASGVLRGDEFNSIAEQAPIIMEAVQKATGKTTGELRKLAETGAITADILIKSLEAYESTINNEFATAIKTFGKRLEDAKTAAITFVGNSDAINDAISATGSSIVFLAESLDVLIKTIAIAGIAMGSSMLVPLVKTRIASLAAAKSVNFLGQVTKGATISTRIFASAATAARGALAFLGGPVGVLVTVATSLALFVDWETKAAKQTRLTNKAIEDQTDALKELSKEDLGKKAIDAELKLIKLRSELETLEATMKRTSGNMGAMGFGSNSFKDASEKAEKLKQEIRLLQEISDRIGSTGELGGKDGLFKKSEESEKKTEDLIPIGGEGTDIQIERAHKKRDAILLAANETLAGLSQSFADELTLEDDFYLAQKEKLAAAIQAKRDAGEGGALFEIEAKNLELQLLTAHEDEKARIKDEKRKEEERKDKEATLAKISNAKMGANALIALAGAFGSKSEKQQKRLRRAQVIVDTAAGVMNAFATAGNIYTALALSAVVVATGKKSLDSINSGRSVSSSRSAPSASPPPQAVANQGQGGGPNRNVTINLTGGASQLFTTEQVRGLIEQINEQVGDGVQLGIAGA